MATKANTNKVPNEILRTVREMEVLKLELAAKEQEHGITKLRQKIEQRKQKVKDFMVENDVDAIDFADGSRRYVKLIRQTFDRQVISDDRDREIVFGGVVGKDLKYTLKEIIEHKYGTIKSNRKARRLWLRVTRRIVDLPELEEAVSEGLLSVDEISPAYYERRKAPYIQTYGGK